MKICFIALRGIPLSDGIATYTDKLATYLCKRGHDVTVYVSNRHGNTDGIYNGSYKIITVNSSKIYFLEKISLMLNASLKQRHEHYDIVHFHSFGNFVPLARKNSKKIVVQSHGIEYERAKWGWIAKLILKYVEKKLFNGDVVTVVSEALQEHFKTKYQKHTVFIPTAVDLPVLSGAIDHRFLEDHSLHAGGYYLFMARIVKEKGLHYLIEAFKQCNTKKKLVIAGPVERRNKYHSKLLKMAASDKRISFLGSVYGANKETLLRGAFAFCQPSETEGLSVALLEAMSFAKCCLVSDIPMNLEAVGECGVVFRNKSIPDLADKIEYIERSPEVVEALGRKARERVQDNYTWGIVAKQMESLYESLLKQ